MVIFSSEIFKNWTSYLNTNIFKYLIYVMFWANPTVLYTSIEQKRPLPAAFGQGAVYCYERASLEYCIFLSAKKEEYLQLKLNLKRNY